MEDPATLDKIIAEAINDEKLQERGEGGEKLAYAPNQQSPYTGWTKAMYDNGQIMMLSQCKDGKLDGLLTNWYNDGQKREERNYKDGNLVTAVAWKPNGDKCPHTNVVNGNGVEVIYNVGGGEWRRHTYKNGKIVKD